MGWFKKKKEVKYEATGAPELLELPKLPKFPVLPSLPGLSEDTTKTMLGFDQEAIKSAISPISSKADKRTLEITDDLPKTVVQKREFMSLMPSTTKPTLSKKIEPVYIRIDKFKYAVQSFQEIQSKVQEIDTLLQKIKEMKQKEDEELREWERELETIKARIDSLDKNIFSKLD